MDPSLPVFHNAIDEGLKTEQVAEVLLVEALLGNHDHDLKINNDDHSTDGSDNLYNLYIFEKLSGGGKLAIPYDFDIASAIVGKSSLDSMKEYIDLNIIQGLDTIRYFILSKILKLHNIFEPSILDLAIKQFKDRQSLAYSALSNSIMDTAGKNNYKEHLDFFFYVLDNIHTFPMIQDEDGVPAFANAEATISCGTLPKGTFVQSSGQQGSRILVHILKPESNADEYYCPPQNPVWISNTTKIGGI